MERWLLAALLFFAACGSAVKDWKLPAELEGGWKLSVVPPSPETYALVQRLTPKRSQMAGYESATGAGLVRIAGFELANNSTAFEQVQKWRAEPGRVVFHHGPWFVVVEADSMDAAGLSKVANAVEKTMPD